MIQKVFILSFFLLSSLLIQAQDSAKNLIGTWKGWDKIIKIYEDADGIQSIYIDEDGNQTHPERIFRDLTIKNGSWEGEVYSIKREKTTDVRCKLITPNELEVKLLIGFFSKSFTWERIH